MPHVFIITTDVSLKWPNLIDSRKCQGAAGMGARADPQGEAIARPRKSARPHIRRTTKGTPKACGARRITRANRRSRQSSRDSHAPDIPQAVTPRTRAAGRSGTRRARGCGGRGAPADDGQPKERWFTDGGTAVCNRLRDKA